MNRTIIVFCALLFNWTLAGQDKARINIQIAAGLRELKGTVEWIQPGTALRAASPRSLVFQFLASHDCYLYAIALPKGSREAFVLWPNLAMPEILRARAGQAISLHLDFSKLPQMTRGGTLAVLVFAKPPLRFHASLEKGRPELAKVAREIRQFQRENSHFAHNGPNDLVLIAGSLRDVAGEVRGLDAEVESFWAGMYEWSTPNAD